VTPLRTRVLAAVLAVIPGVAGAQHSVAEIVAAAAEADVVLLGEVHDNPRHHAVQAEVLDGLSPAALVFEMISADEADRITPDIAADAPRLADVLDWSASGWPEFSYYAPLFAFGTARPVYGAEVGRDAAQAAFDAGAAAVFSGDAARFGLERALPEAQQAAREADQLAAHCDALPPEILPGFVEAQRLRDASLARAALQAHAAHGAPVAVITGNGHARRDWGVPALLAIAAPALEVVALGQFEAAPEGEVPFDMWTVADPVDRADPCAAFR
jgi:uncharacterized iron-regulated protein